MITKQEALRAYNMLKDYCKAQGKCKDCLFATEDDTYGECIMECQDVPRGWQVLEIDENMCM